MFWKGLDHCFLTLVEHYVWWSLFCLMLLCQGHRTGPNLLSPFQMPTMSHLAWLRN